MIESAIKIGRQVNKFLTPCSIQRNNAKLIKPTNLIS